MVIIETSVFTRLIQDLLGDDDYRELQQALVQHPDLGDLIPSSGGLRKVRWKITGKGKRAGIRVIYYWMTTDNQLWMLYAYAKGRQSDLDHKQLAILRDIVDRWQK
jgi:hypothetical protein